MINKYKTSLEALETSRRLWKLLADGTADCKRAAYSILKLPRDAFDCPCCEFAKPRSGLYYIDCSLCPLFRDYGEDIACEEYDTPWRRYLEAVANNRDIKPAAREMLDLINRKISKLKKA